MAKATSKKTVTEVTLTLTPAEADVIRDILDFVGGEPKLTRRGLAQNVSEALAAAGVEGSGYPVPDVDRKGPCGIYFTTNSRL